MRRALRHLFTILSAISLLLFVTIAVFCVRALMGGNDYVEFRSSDPPIPQDQPSSNAPQEEWSKFLDKYYKWDRKRWGVHLRANANGIFAFGRQPFFGYPANGFGIHLYYWWVFPFAAILPLAFAMTRWRKRKWEREGACPICGYDLRASPERCPECGTPNPRAVSSAV